ncbi:tRNA (guanosine(46)-N7)-methyltransferase TrmB [Arthrobacter sp. UM1]|uniref:tRNA (guanosine(46)-N7)-methyltransferase TrmB n=1 Tax=Arthrobacter sp. UM1 TaxID=2766776 RepID=UPI001CF610BA|nr:tRNA (guanosine(46)-N7)-methyltransferase TrmB [Arthrobacter sp. UM1]MCB4208419.1 tRNA (guanosine(46)-N7)-methyltransferase TrmB [Arthrobacter sp. UM1]
MTDDLPNPDSHPGSDSDANSPSGLPSRHRTQPVSFVRRGSRLQGRRKEAWEELADTYLIDVPRSVADTSVDPGFVLDVEAAFGRAAELVVEIGSGLGEAITHAAAEHPERDFLALEVYKPGLANTMLKIRQAGLTNVRVAQVNAPEALATMLPEGSASEVWVFFPDPWPKTKHHKRRLVQPSLAPLVRRALRPGGVWRLATDWSEYAQHMRQVLDDAEGFRNLHAGERAGSESPLTRVWQEGLENVAGVTARAGRKAVLTEEGRDETDELGGWAPRFEGRVLTSFEAKGHSAGREVFDLAYEAV